jgi:putative molybdopterin biosynthesis protein
MEKRNLYLKNTPVDEAGKIFMAEVKEVVRPSYETVDVTESLGRVTRSAVFAKYSSPHYNAAAMDGIAVRAESTAGASEVSPLILKENEYKQVNTGNLIEEPYNAVIMAEDIVELDNGGVRITAAAASWQHIRLIGEDISVGEMVIPGSHKIRPIDIPVLLEAGILKIEVLKKPRVAIFPTGNEIIEPESASETLNPGEIIESNSRMFENMIKEAGGEPHRFSILPDDYETIKKAVSAAAEEYDVIITNAGTSAGLKDFTVHVLNDIGRVLIHGVAVKPGKPCILAFVNDKPVIGLPGYPVSAYIGFENFVVPLLDYMLDHQKKTDNTVKAVISKRIISGLKYREYIRVKVGNVGGRLTASPLARGAGAAMSLVKADGFCVVPQESEGLEAGDEVEVTLYRPLNEVENTAVLIGSHDIILDILADMMSGLRENMYVSSTHVGSMAGLMSLRRHEAHMAPTHLLDAKTGTYNIPYIKSMFKEPMALIKGVHRIQGLMVKKGNPLNITGIADIVGKRYVNRQRGAGTRVLLDYKLEQLGIETSQIDGYDREANTHLAVAAAVKSESADVGMGVLSAAAAMGLDFIKVGIEEYDFAIPQAYLELPVVKKFIELLKSEQFHRRLDELGGYEYDESGKIVLQ